MSEELQELAIYKDLLEIVHIEVATIRDSKASPDLGELKILASIYCMLKDGLREDIKNGIWEKLQVPT